MKRKQLKKQIALWALAALAALPAAARADILPNTTLPERSDTAYITNGTTFDRQTNVMNITQSADAAIIEWDQGFNVGANATVNFMKSGGGEFSTLNYDSSAALSHIYGAINAENGNIYIVNPAGVTIGDSAQINVGSLNVSNTLDDALKSTFKDLGTASFKPVSVSDGELMSLGNINAREITFLGGRVVLDIERTRNDDGMANVTVTGSDVVLGYDPTAKYSTDIKVNGSTEISAYKYEWIKKLSQLKALAKGENESADGYKERMAKNYALRYDVDAVETKASGYTPIGTETTPFTGKFDGLGHSIFGLQIAAKDTNGNVMIQNSTDSDNVGLFGAASGATIRNFNLVDGLVTGRDNVGAVVGNAKGTTVISGITSSVNVIGRKDVGGIVGCIQGGSTLEDVVNVSAIYGHENVGGLAGRFVGGSITGQSYNLGSVNGFGKEDENSTAESTTDEAKAIKTILEMDNVKSGYSHDVGGLVGMMNGTTVRNETGATGETQQVFNTAFVTGGYNVGGIAGEVKAGNIQNAYNEGEITAAGWVAENYTFHTDYSGTYYNSKKDQTAYSSNGTRTVSVRMANAGGIAGATGTGGNVTVSISNVKNEGNVAAQEVESDSTFKDKHYGAGNVGGIAGYFGRNGTGTDTYKITSSMNSGGDIEGTGGILAGGTGYTKEITRNDYKAENNEEYITGNIGGVAGYLEGDNLFIYSSVNSGTVHAEDVDGADIPETAKAANVGGIVGKIDRAETETAATRLEKLKSSIKNVEEVKAQVYGSYNTGGIVGYWWNGSIKNVFNAGNITVRNEVGDEYSAVGGIVGAVDIGGGNVDATGSAADMSITNAYNLGVLRSFSLVADVNTNYPKGLSTLGGIVGEVVQWKRGTLNDLTPTYGLTISNVYTLGNFYSATYTEDKLNKETGEDGTSYTADTDNSNAFIGMVRDTVKGDSTDATKAAKIEVSNAAYILPNTKRGYSVNFSESDKYKNQSWTPKDTSSNQSVTFKNVKVIEYDKRYDPDQYKDIFTLYYSDGKGGFVTKKDDGTKTAVTADNFNENSWRVYQSSNTDTRESLPILNAFLPGYYNYFSDSDNWSDYTGQGGTSVQYGTAFNPLNTMLYTTGNLTFRREDMDLGNDNGISVYGGGLTLTDVDITNPTGVYAGTIYADGALRLTTAAEWGKESTNEVNSLLFGTGSALYGSEVTLDTQGELGLYGTVKATGNEDDTNTSGGITITAGGLDVHGKLETAAAGEATKLDSINVYDDDNFSDDEKEEEKANITNPMKDVQRSAVGYAKTVRAAKGIAGDLNITVTSNTLEDGMVTSGDVFLTAGNLKQGQITVYGDTAITADNDIYIDSDVSAYTGSGEDKKAVAKDLTLKADGEIVFDISNIGSTENGGEANAQAVQDYLAAHSGESGGTITFAKKDDTANEDAKFAVDLSYESGSSYDFNKYDTKTTLQDAFGSLNLENGGTSAEDSLFIWVGSAEQLKAIETSAKSKPSVLTKNFALKNDIDGTNVSDYASIAGGDDESFTGIFDGRGSRIITIHSTAGGIFGSIGEGGVVRNVSIYDSSVFSMELKENVGLVADENAGVVENITSFGNRVEGKVNVGGLVGENKTEGVVQDSISMNVVLNTGTSGYAGGIAGVNDGLIMNTESESSVASEETLTGTDENGNINSAIGGVAGSNSGIITMAQSLGTTSGIYPGKEGAYKTVSNVGGIAGVNSGSISSVYNGGIATGFKDVGGIVGQNTADADGSAEIKKTDGDGNEVKAKAGIENAANGAYIYGGEDVGGIAGTNAGSIKEGRNNSYVIGDQMQSQPATGDALPADAGNVGGLVGVAKTGSTMENLTNDEASIIRGKTNVGGLIGLNQGDLSSSQNLMNYSTIAGVENVGGAVGKNDTDGVISGINNANVAKITTAEGFMKTVGGTDKVDAWQYVGGIVGLNAGTVENVSNSAALEVTDAQYVGGVIGQNAKDGKVAGLLANGGDISSGKAQNENGGQYVGGIIGDNQAEIKTADDAESDVTLINGAVVKTSEDGTADWTSYELAGASVSGVSDVGGVIGNNAGAITKANVINTVTGSVTASGDYAGGLFGTNAAAVSGGRDSGNNYYRYQVYNNGSVTASGSYAGGLAGKNAEAGSISQAYNTGSVTAGGNYAGGIAGDNAGKLSEVFNTISVRSGDETSGYTWSDGMVSAAASYAGGLAGANSGTITDAYSTSAVSVGADGVAGNIVGQHTGGTISKVYSSQGSGKFIGESSGMVENSISFSPSDEGATGITVLSGDDQTTLSKYTGFDTTGTTWFNFDTITTPILSAFLTNVEVEFEDSADTSFTYNGKAQGYIVEPTLDKDGNPAADDDGGYTAILYKTTDGGATKTKIGTITAKDENAIHSLMDYFESYSGSDDGTNLINGHQNTKAGSYKLLSSKQIKSAGGNTNFLGYKFMAADQTTQPKPTNPTDPTDPTYPGSDPADPGTPVDPDAPIDPTDPASPDNPTNDPTNGDVSKRQILVTLDDITRTYGDADFTSGNGKTTYGESFTWNYVGDDTDSLSSKDFTISVTEESDGAVDGKLSGQTATADAGTYRWTAGASLAGDTDNFTLVAGADTLSANSLVKKKAITVTADGRTTMIGIQPLSYTGADVQPLLVNGDGIEGADYGYGINTPWYDSAGNHAGVVGFLYGGKIYFAGTQSGLAGVFRNYDVTVVPGDGLVFGKENGDADRWDYLYRDGPDGQWGRVRNFRERRAELFFVAGGMTL